jgi:hypothetical protein
MRHTQRRTARADIAGSRCVDVLLNNALVAMYCLVLLTLCCDDRRAAINVPTQKLADSTATALARGDAAPIETVETLTQRKINLNDLYAQIKHYNVNVRRGAYARGTARDRRDDRTADGASSGCIEQASPS